MVSTTAAAASARIASTTISSTSVKPLRGGRALAVSTVNIRIVVGPAGGAVGAERPDVERRPVRSRRLIMIGTRSEEHTSELQSLMRNSYAVFCLKKKNNTN